MKERTNSLIQNFFDRNKELIPIKSIIIDGAQAMLHTYERGGKILLCGNGGSSSDCDHIVGELMKEFLLKRPLSSHVQKELIDNFGEEGKYLAASLQGSLPAISLHSQNAFISAFSNDVDPYLIYAQQVLGYAKKEDLLIGISTSGNARNVKSAFMVGRVLGIKTMLLAGKDGGAISPLGDISIIAPADETYQIQEMHEKIYHFLCLFVESELFD